MENQRVVPMRGSRKFSGGGGVQVPRRGLTENFNMAKINNLAIPGGGSGPPVPPSGSAHGSPFENICTIVIILLKINLEGYQDPNVKDTYKILNVYVYIEIKCDSRQIN